MPKRAAGLTAREVQTLRTPGLIADGGGLYLQITKTGAKSWIYRYQIAGRRRDMGLGSVEDVGLAAARERADELRKLVKAGTDPLEARKAAAAAQVALAAEVVTFKACAETFLGSRQAGWRNAKHAAQWRTTLARYAYPVMGDLPVSMIDTDAVLRVVEPIWATKTETASRLRGRIEAVLDYAKVRGYRGGDSENPARWRGHLSHILVAKIKLMRGRHHASLPYKDMPAFWPRLQVQDGLGARALELVVLTATRSGEVLGARWAEIDLDDATWIVPAERMKAGQEHRVPLSDPAVALLRKLATIRSGEFVFPGASGKKPLSNMAMAMVLRRMKSDVTVHGFRATFRTWVAEQTQFPEDVAEAALAHTPKDKIVAAYQRGDLFEKRRRLMADWAAFVEGGK